MPIRGRGPRRKRPPYRVALPIAIALLTASMATTERGTPRAVAATPPRPNILIIVTDDQRDQGTLDVMPNTRTLFQQGGRTFANAYDSTPLCCPARGSLWSGRYAHNHGVKTNGDLASEQRYDQTTTIQSYLSAAGYRTSLVGKYWNQWPLRNPPPYFQRFALTAVGYNDAVFNVNGVQGPQPGYSTDVTGNLVVSELQRYEADDQQPWFMYVATHAPHADYTPSATYANAPVPPWVQSPAVLETDRGDKPPKVRNTTQPLASVASVRAAQLRTLMSVDDMVGRIYDEMDRLGEQDTLAFYLSDNGFLWGEHGQLAKRFPYTDSVGVPMMMRWPGQVAGGGSDARLVTQMDVAPTILDSLDIPSTHTFDGASLLTSDARTRVYLEYFKSPDAPGIGSWASDLTTDHQYVEWYADDGSVSFREYYDLVADPWQLTNLLADGNAGNDPPTAALSAMLAGDRTCAGLTCPQPVSSTPDTVPPSAPGTPTATSVRAGEVDVSWAAASDDRATVLRYDVFRDDGTTPIGSFQSGSSATVSFVDIGLAPGATHSYVVRANDGTNDGPFSGRSNLVTVSSEPPPVFADAFSSGLGAWTKVKGITIDQTAGGIAPPSARGNASGTVASAFRNLGSTLPTACMSANVRLGSIGSTGVALFRLRTAADGAFARVTVTPARVLTVRADVPGTVRSSGRTITLGSWNSVELCGTTGSPGSLQLFLNGVSILGPWSVDTGTTPVGGINLWENAAKTFVANLDDVVVDTHPG